MRLRLHLWARLAALSAAVCLCAGCERFPKDPQQTLEGVLERGVLRVGATESSPWVVKGGEGDAEAGGLEGQLLTEFAQELGVRIEWRWGGAEEILSALERYELDLAAGGLTQGNPWKKRLGLSIPYYTSRAFVAVPPATPADFELDGATVAVRPASGLREKLKGRGAEVVEREDLAGFGGPIATELWRLEAEAEGFRTIGEPLRTRRHVLAAPPGENAMLMRLESFLLKSADEARFRRLLREASQQ